MPDESLSSSLDYLFGFFEARHHLHRGRYDRDVRCPDVFLEIARSHGILPPPERTVVITGSKGKGSCARLTAAYLQEQGYRVGLVLTPEERSHLDRIRIDGNSIQAAVFVRLLDMLKPSLEKAMHSADALFYHPPTSIFLLIALMHFREEEVDYFVIEGGRGAQFDEIGVIDAAVGVITSILPEHLSRLGPGIAEICIDKFSLSRTCAAVVCSEQAWQQAQRHAPGLIDAPRRQVVSGPNARTAQPAWVATADALAKATLLELGKPILPQKMSLPCLASCQVIDATRSSFLDGDQRVFLDGAVHAQCLDLSYIRSGHCMPEAFIIGMTADKDVSSVLQMLQSNFARPVYFFRPFSTSEHVSAPVGIAEWAGDFDVSDGLDEASRRGFLSLLNRHSRLYVIGVQVFLRSVRNALDA